jgi:hypothetical protein
MSRYGAKCWGCDNLIMIDTEGHIPFFNQTKKRNWLEIVCVNCSYPQRGAKFSHSSNSLFVVPE